MPRMGAIGILLFLVTYIFAVMFTQLFKDLTFEDDDGNPVDYFSDLQSTFFTLFQIMTFDSWTDITRMVMEHYKWAWIPFIAFVVLTGFIVVNLIIAVICDAISALNEEKENEEEDKTRMSRTAGGGGDGETLTITERDISHSRGGASDRLTTPHFRDGQDNNDNDNEEDDWLYDLDLSGPLPEEQISQQLDLLDAQVEELSRAQIQNLYMIEYLTHRLEMKNNEQ
jgi:hypothetical protein